jgi:hypothetical protein
VVHPRAAELVEMHAYAALGRWDGLEHKHAWGSGERVSAVGQVT